jgi:hypothetical protein
VHSASGPPEVRGCPRGLDESSPYYNYMIPENEGPRLTW